MAQDVPLASLTAQDNLTLTSGCYGSCSDLNSNPRHCFFGCIQCAQYQLQRQSREPPDHYDGSSPLSNTSLADGQPKAKEATARSQPSPQSKIGGPPIKRNRGMSLMHHPTYASYLYDHLRENELFQNNGLLESPDIPMTTDVTPLIEDEERPGLDHSETTLSCDSSMSLSRYHEPLRKNESKKQTLLACPFYKQNPGKHQDCLKFELRRVKDVKQHIYRKHLCTCQSCQEQPRASDLRHHPGHKLACRCEATPSEGGISIQTRNELARDNRRGRTVEMQWYKMWEILFPHQASPQSCYLGNYAEEALPQIRAFWNERRYDILKGVLSNTSDNSGNFEVLDQAMSVVFDRFQAEVSNMPTTETAKPAKASAVIGTQTLAATSWSGEELDIETSLKGLDHTLWQQEINEPSDIDYLGMQPSDWILNLGNSEQSVCF